MSKKDIAAMSAAERAVHKNVVAAERAIREAERERRRAAGTLFSPSANRKKKKHGRP